MSSAGPMVTAQQLVYALSLYNLISVWVNYVAFNKFKTVS